MHTNIPVLQLEFRRFLVARELPELDNLIELPNLVADGCDAVLGNTSRHFQMQSESARKTHDFKTACHFKN